MKDHQDKGILQIDYNILDLPDLVKFNKTYVPRFTGTEIDYNVKTKYLYRADGAKLRKIYTYGTGKTNLEASTITDYLDGFQYEEKYTGSLSSPVLKFVPTSEGYYDFEKNKYIYTYTDHLGNVRLSYFKNSNDSAEVIEENSYYPFGMKHATNILSINSTSYKYQYNGKEYQTETKWNDYAARMYMSDIARWGVIDPLAETSRRFSPYNYAYDNPISFVDPDGRKAMAVDEGWSWNVPVSSGWFNERRNFGSFDEFIKLTSSNERERGSAGGGSAPTFGETQAYNDMMSAWQNGQSFGLSNNFGVLSWWTDADGAQYGQYNMMKFATPSNDKWEGSSYGAITGLSSYLAILIGSTNETFYSFSGGINDPDKETLNKLKPRDNIEINDMFEQIFMFYGRNTKLTGGSTGFQEALVQFGLDIEGVGSPFNFKSNDSINISATLYYPYPHDTIKTVLEKNINKGRENLQKKVDSINEVEYKKGWHYKTYGW